MTWSVDTASPLSPSAQLVACALDRIAAGALAPGDRLPSVRALAAEARVNPNTAARAWRDLEQLGVARGENGRGVFVTATGPAIAADMRRDATRTALDEALAAALRAGHAPEDLLARITAALGRTTRAARDDHEPERVPA